jgi:hypothetical protein
MSKKTINLLSTGHKKQLIPYTIRFFSFISAVTLATVYVVYVAAGANTTIGNNISTSGTLTIGNTALFSGTLRASSTLQVTGSTTLYTALTVSGTGTSTFANGLNLSGGCFAVNGTCVTGGGGGGGSGTVNAGTQGQVAFYNDNGDAVSGTSTLTIATTTKVGIGTSNPLSALDVRGDGLVRTQTESGSSGVSARVFGSGAIAPGVFGRFARGTEASPAVPQNNDNLLAFTGRGWTGTDFSTASNVGIFLQAAGTFSASSNPTKIIFNTTPANSTTALTRLFIGSDGGIGIGNSNPSKRLDISGDVRISTSTAGAALAIDSNGSSSVELNITSADNDNNIRFVNTGNENWQIGNVNGAFRFYHETASSIPFQINQDDSATFSGPVNISTTTGPSVWNLQVSGDRPFIALSDTAAGTNLKHWTISSQGGDLYIATSSDALATSTFSIFRISSNGNTGIGIPSGGLDSPPTFRLQVFGSANVSSATNSGGFVLQNPLTAANNNESRMLFRLRNSAATLTDFASVGGLAEDITSSLGALIFTTRSGGSLNERARITSSGNLGIGTTTPGTLLSLHSGSDFINFGVTSTSTFSKGINLNGGCFAVNGTCVGGGGGGSGTVNNGTQGQVAFYDATGTAVSGTSSIFIAQNNRVGIGTTNPQNILSVAGFVDITGPLGIGTTSPSKTFSVQGSSIVSATSTVEGQILAQTFAFDPNNNVMTVPAYSFKNDSDTGMFNSEPDNLAFGTAGTMRVYMFNTAMQGNTTGTFRMHHSAAGSASAPTYAFYGSGLNDGMFSPLDNTVAFTTGGSERVRIDSSGNVGIGTTSPSQPLSVHGNTLFSGDISSVANIIATGTIYTPSLQSLPGDGTSISLLAQNGTTGAGGNITITAGTGAGGQNGGTSLLNGGTGADGSGAGKLQAFGGGGTVGGNAKVLGGNASGNGGDVYLQGGDGSTGNGGRVFIFGGAGSGTGGSITLATGLAGTAGAIDLQTNGASRLYILAGGNVGIGTTSPSQLLSVHGNALFSGNITSIANITATGTVTIGTSATTSARLFVTDGVATGTPGIPGVTQNLAWFASSSSIPVIGVENTAYGVKTFLASLTGGTIGPRGSLAVLGGPLSFSVGGSEPMLITTDGKVGIGTSSPGTVLALSSGGDFSNFAVTSTSTLSKGLNILGGCIAINGTCVGAGGGGSGTVNNGTQGHVAFYDATDTAVSGTSTIFISTAEKVGVGTSSPSERLHVSNGHLLIEDEFLIKSRTTIGTARNVLGVSANVTNLYDPQGSPTLRVWSSKVGIGGNLPNNTLSVAGDADITGSLGIGTTSPSQPLSVHGNALFSGDLSVANITATGTINVSAGSAYKYNSVNVITSSTTLNNYFFGNSGNLTMTGNDNIALGVQALNANTFGTANTAIGSQALNANTTGNSNTAIGQGALSFNTTGFFNTAIGRNALLNLNITGGLGVGANTAIGYNTGLGITTGVNNTIIGANVTGLSSTLSNNIIIADGEGNQRINVGSTGSVGIGTTTSITSSTTRLFITDGNATGTPSFSQALITPLLWGASTANIPVFGLENTSIGAKVILTAISDEGGARALLTTLSNHPLSFETGGDGSALWIDTNDFIGIGTTTPGERLVVDGNFSLTGNILPSLAPTTTALSGNATSTIDTSAIPQGHSITIGTNGFPIIAYQESLQNLLVAKCNDLACSAPTISTVVSGNVGSGTSTISIAIGTDGRPFITYQDGPTGELRLAICGNASCSSGNSTTTIDTIGFGSGASNSIAIAPEGIPVISYYHTTAGELRFATCGTVGTGQVPCIDSSVSTSILDGSGDRDAGQFNSLAVGADGIPVISYYDVTNGNLNVAQCFNSTCGGFAATTSPDTGGDVGQYTSIAIGTDGLPIISYYDVTNADLKVAKCANTGCTTGTTVTTQDSTGDVGRFSSITITTGGLPLIAYYDVTNADLKVDGCANASCSSNSSHKSVDTDNNVGEFASISIGTDGMPIIAYYSRTTGNLRFVRCNNFTCQNSSGGFFSGSDIGSIGKFFNNAYIDSLWAKQIAIKRFDLAEDYYSKSALEAGDIVALDPNEYLHVNKANAEDGTRIVGIVSTEPALVLSDFLAPPSNSKNYPIALAGRVPVKVNMEGGEIKVGDPITMSSVSGVGRKAHGSAGGRNIGYALEAYNNGSATAVGKIMVFVNLSDTPVDLSALTSKSGERIPAPSLLSQVVSLVNGWLESMKVTIQDGLLKVKNLVAEKITAKKAVLDKIELKDEESGETYCVRMKGGKLVSTLGECASASNNEQQTADNNETEDAELNGPSQAPPSPPGNTNTDQSSAENNSQDQELDENQDDTGANTSEEQSTGSTTPESGE